MNHRKLIGIFALLLACKFVGAENVTKTLSSPNGDKVSVAYTVTQKNGKVTIQLTDVRQALGESHGKEYEDDEVVVLFFSRNGSFGEKGTEFQGESTKAFMSPAGLTYNKPEEDDGFFIASQKPVLSFDSKATEAVTLSIPFYLATHPKRGVYNIFESCGNLNIRIGSGPETNPKRKESQQATIEYTIEEEESSFSFDDEAKQRIAHVNTLLDFQEGAFSPDLINEIASLAALREKVKNKNVLKAIDETLAKCDEKRGELKQQAKHQEDINQQKEEDAQENTEFRQCRTIEDYDHFLKLYPNSKHKAEAEKNREELKKKKEEEDSKQKKRTIWMIVGGGLLAALLFVGNQVMQSIRNIKTQRSIMEMQKSATREATGNAKRRVKSIMHNKAHQAMNVTRNKSRDIVQKGVEKTKNVNLKKDVNKGDLPSNKPTDANKVKTMKKSTNSNNQFSI
jgi:hypothetical protein